MTPEELPQLRDEIQQKLPEILSKLSEVLQKYDVSDAIEVEIKLNKNKLKPIATKAALFNFPLRLGKQQISLANAIWYDDCPDPSFPDGEGCFM
jgi:septum formation topological specificity factor MinE